MNARIDHDSAVPWWAAFGAPLLGVPILVGLLALGSPGQASTAPAEADAVFSTEQVEASPATVTLEMPAESTATLSRC